MRYVNLTSEITLGEALQRLGEAYQSVDASALVMKHEEVWQNVIMVIRFLNDAVDQVGKRHEKLSGLFGKLLGDDGGTLFHAIDFADWPAFEKRFGEGYVDFGIHSVKTRVKSDDFASSLCRNSSDTIESTRPDKFPRISCQIQFEDKKEIFVGDKMFAGVALNRMELSKSCLGFEGEKSYGALFELPIYSRISEQDFSNPEKPIIRIESHPSLLSEVGCALVQKYNPHEYREQVRKSIYFDSSELKWTQDERWAHAEIPFDLDRHEFMHRDVLVARLVMDFAMVDSDDAYLRQHLPLQSPGEPSSPGILSALSLCDGWKRIEEMLGLIERKPPFIRQKTDAFSMGISWLLEVIGFRVVLLENSRANLSLGIIRSEENQGGRFELGEIDILAWNEEKGIAYAIDCTLNPPFSRKADSLSNCADVIEDVGHVRCSPLIMVATRAENSKENIKTVVILDKDDISQLLDLVLRGETEEAGRLFDNLMLGTTGVLF